MNCMNCGSALPVHSDICRYCGTLNDTDIGRLRPRQAEWEKPSDLTCPRCEIPLKGLKVTIDRVFRVERCGGCLGIFFGPPGELEELLDLAVPHLREIDFERLANFAEESKQEAWPTRYIPCPVCGKFMNRKNYGALAGVIVDRCKDHGLWLDGGELGKLLRWARMGGREKTELQARERQRMEERNAMFRDLDSWLRRNL